MHIEDFEIGEVIGIKTEHGLQYFERTKHGLEGPFIDRECTIEFMDPAIRAEVQTAVAAAGERHYITGKRRRNKQYTMSDGAKYRTDMSGTIRRETPRQTKKERQALKDAQTLEGFAPSQAQTANPAADCPLGQADNGSGADLDLSTEKEVTPNPTSTL